MVTLIELGVVAIEIGSSSVFYRVHLIRCSPELLQSGLLSFAEDCLVCGSEAFIAHQEGNNYVINSVLSAVVL